MRAVRILYIATCINYKCDGTTDNLTEKSHNSDHVSGEPPHEGPFNAAIQEPKMLKDISTPLASLILQKQKSVRSGEENEPMREEISHNPDDVSSEPSHEGPIDTRIQEYKKPSCVKKRPSILKRSPTFNENVEVFIFERDSDSNLESDSKSESKSESESDQPEGIRDKCIRAVANTLASICNPPIPTGVKLRRENARFKRSNTF